MKLFITQIDPDGLNTGIIENDLSSISEFIINHSFSEDMMDSPTSETIWVRATRPTENEFEVDYEQITDYLDHGYAIILGEASYESTMPFCTITPIR